MTLVFTITYKKQEFLSPSLLKEKKLKRKKKKQNTAMLFRLAMLLKTNKSNVD